MDEYTTEELKYKNGLEEGRRQGREEMRKELLPCKVGDEVWGIRCYRGVMTPQKGFVSELLFMDGMRLCITVKHICRGEWGKKVFASREAAEAALVAQKERRDR